MTEDIDYSATHTYIYIYIYIHELEEIKYTFCCHPFYLPVKSNA